MLSLNAIVIYAHCVVNWVQWLLLWYLPLCDLLSVCQFALLMQWYLLECFIFPLPGGSNPGWGIAFSYHILWFWNIYFLWLFMASPFLKNAFSLVSRKCFFLEQVSFGLLTLSPKAHGKTCSPGVCISRTVPPSFGVHREPPFEVGALLLSIFFLWNLLVLSCPSLSLAFFWLIKSKWF